MTIDKFLSTFPDDILDEDQKNAVRVMSPGCILNGKTGSGKSRAGLAYYKFNLAIAHFTFLQQQRSVTIKSGKKNVSSLIFHQKLLILGTIFRSI